LLVNEFGSLEAVLAAAPVLPAAELQVRMERFKQLTREYLAGFPAVEQKLAAWDYTLPVPWYQAFTSFIFGREWLTASFWQDWYGVIPLFIGTLMVSAVALVLAVPLGVGAAIYVNQIATATEQRFIKPGIEFISAIPSVVLGFFGIAVLGQALGQALVKWISMEVVDAKPVGRTESDEAIHLADYVKDVRLAGDARIRPLGI
jgi:phosphate transport system permease protein